MHLSQRVTGADGLVTSLSSGLTLLTPRETFLVHDVDVSPFEYIRKSSHVVKALVSKLSIPRLLEVDPGNLQMSDVIIHALRFRVRRILFQ